MSAFDFNAWHRTAARRGERSPVVHPVVCADGFQMSVQASYGHYCRPREDDAYPYEAVEVGFPSEPVEALMEWAEDRDNPTGTVYGWVPVEVVNGIVNAHGGVAP